MSGILEGHFRVWGLARTLKRLYPQAKDLKGKRAWPARNRFHGIYAQESDQK